MAKLKVGQRIKYRNLRGTILSAYIPALHKDTYQIRFDNGIMAIGTGQQLKPVMRRSK